MSTYHKSIRNPAKPAKPSDGGARRRGGPSIPPPRHTRASTLMQNRNQPQDRSVAQELLDNAINFRFACVRDVVAGDLMTGMSAINSDNIVASLMEADTEYWAGIMSWFHQRQREIDDEMEVQHEVIAEKKRRYSEAIRRRSSAPPPLPGMVHASTQVEANEGLEDSSSDDELDKQREKYGVPSKKRHDPRFGMTPWRAVFNDWIAILDNELQTGQSLVYAGDNNTGVKADVMAAGGTAISQSMLIPVEVFINRVTEATRLQIESKEPTPNASAKSSKVNSPTTSSKVSEIQRNYMRHFVPHHISTATAFYCFNVHIIPMLGEYASLARQALAELAKAAFMYPPVGLLKELGIDVEENGGEELSRSRSPGVGKEKWRGRDLAGSPVNRKKAPPSITDDASATYVHTTFVTEFHRVKEMFWVLRETAEKKGTVAERQEMILHRTILRMTTQTARRLLVAWRMHTQRVKKLRERYRQVFAGLADSVFIKHQLRHWKSQARMLLIRKRAEEEGKLPKSNEQVARKKRIAQSQELAVLIEQKKYKETMMERTSVTNLELKDRISKLEMSIRQQREKNQKIGSSFVHVVDAISPAPDQNNPFYESKGSQAINKLADEVNTDDDLHNEAMEEQRMQTIHWIALTAGKDSATAGHKLSQCLMQFAMDNPNAAFNLGVLSRGHHLLPLLRILITVLSPPKIFYEAKVGAPKRKSMAGRRVTIAELPPPRAPTAQGASSDDPFGAVVSVVDDDPNGDLQQEMSLIDTAPELAAPKRKNTFANFSARLSRLASAISEKDLPKASSSNTLKDEPQGQDQQLQSPLSLKSGGDTPTEDSGGSRNPSPKVSFHKKGSLNAFRAFEAAAEQLSVSAFGRSDAEREAMKAKQAEEEAERLKEVQKVLRGLLECGDALAFTNYIINLCNRLVKAQAAPMFKTVPMSLGVHLSKRSESWRNLVLSLVYFTQFGSSAGCFRALPQPRPFGSKPVERNNSLLDDSGSPRAGDGTEHGSPKSPLSPPSFDALRKRRATGLRNTLSMIKDKEPNPNEVQLKTAPEMRGFWQERRTKRRACGDDARAESAMEFHHACVGSLARSAFYGDDIAQEAHRVYTTYSAASPTIANSRVISTEFLAVKLRIIFGKDSSFWRPVASTRTISSAHEMEEFIVTISSLSGMSPYHLTDKLISVLDDTDLFFVALGSEALFSAFSTHLADLSVIFSLYAEGEPPDFVVTAQGWHLLNRPLVDSSYTQQMVTEAFNSIMSRNKKNNKIFRQDDSDDLQQDDESGDQSSQSQAVAEPKPSAGATLAELNKKTFASGGAGLDTHRGSAVSQQSADELEGLNMDGFCQALCVVMSYKDPNPFISLDAKVSTFIQALLVPMVGAKSKMQMKRMTIVDSGPGAAAAEYRRASIGR